MKKIFISGKDGIGWSIDQDRKNAIELIKKIKDAEIIHDPFFSDVIYSVWYEEFLNFFRYYFYSLLKKLKKIKICAVVTNDISNNPEKAEKLKKLIDIWIAPNTKILNFLKEKNLKSILIPFLVDDKIFHHLNLSKKDICQKLGINFREIEGKFLIGSFQRDSLGSDLKKPKWQKNPDLLIEILNKLPKDKYKLILAGPRRHYLINKCRKLGIPYLFIGNAEYIKNEKDDVFQNNISLENINLLYNLIDLYIVPSKSEGGPKAVLEASLAKTPIISTDVGIAADFLHPSLIFDGNNADLISGKINSRIQGENNLQEIMDYNYQKTADGLNKDLISEKLKQAIFYEN